MSNSNYPAGVSDSHPHFNPPRESATAVECGADSALVIPSFVVKAALNEMLDHMTRKEWGGGVNHATIKYRVIRLQEQISKLEQEREYECPFSDEVDLEESECAQWVCPVCGNERETDNLPEDRDPDYDHDRDR